MKVLLATNVDDLDDAIASENGIELVSEPVLHREEVVQVAELTKPEVVVLTSWLNGNMDIIDVVYQLRSLDIRVIFIAANLTREDLTIQRILELGVHDILFGEIRIGQVLERITQLDNDVELNAIVDGDGDDDPDQEKENAFSKLIKTAGDIRKNIPNVTASMLPKKIPRAIVLEKVVAVCSPVPAGKTFVAVNLATVIAQEGYTVALVDTDYKKFGVHTWLKCTGGEDGLTKAISDSGDPILYAYQPGHIPGLYVFTNDPVENTPLISDNGLVSLLDSLQEHIDIIILDTISDFTAPVTKTALTVASTLVIVTDPDASHLRKVQKEIYNFPDDFNYDKCVVVANQLVNSDKLPFADAEHATNMKTSCVIPNYGQSVLESIKEGLPAVMFDLKIKQVFVELLYNELA